MRTERTTWAGTARAAGVTVGALAGTSVLASLGAAWYFARVLLTPEREKPDNTVVLDVDTESPTGANALYERLGFRPNEREVAYVEEH